MLNNFSPWQASFFDGWLSDRTLAKVVLVKQSFEFDEKGNVTPNEPGPDIVVADDYNGDPAYTQLSEVNEQVAFKHGFEVYGDFTAYPPKAKQARVIEVELGLYNKTQPLFNKRLRVTGTRFWKRSLLGPVATDPNIIEPTPINYSNAFGGKNLNDETDYLLENPIGKGFKLKNKQAKGQQLPCIEYANNYFVNRAILPQLQAFQLYHHIGHRVLNLCPTLIKKHLWQAITRLKQCLMNILIIWHR